jgi:sodium-dependent dicarboxylate transporter 2/3/5
LNVVAAEGVRLPPARIAILALGGIAAATSVVLDWSAPARAAIIAAVCVALWLGEVVPVWVPTVILWIATPLLLASASESYAPARVLGWSVDPVLALFLAGFALAAAASAQGVDRAVAALALRLSRGRPVRLVVLIALATAVLSMWMSNVAAAALMLAALRPVLDGDRSSTGTLRRPLLLAVALAADVGGIATPVGTGPNGMAMAALERTHPINFVQWMLFGVPLAFGLIAAALAVILWRVRPTDAVALPETAVPGPTARSWRLGIVFAATVLLWLTEPLHGVRAWVVALGAVAALVAAGLLGWRDARRMDWSTLLLIAGGIALGALLEQSGLAGAAAAYLPLASAPPTVRLLVLCVVSASLSAVMSNTATAAFLIPLTATLDPAPSTVILVAISASLGIPFVISTPPNAMAVGTGLLRSRELLVPGLVIMLGGCVLVALTGPSVLRLFGVP